MKKDKGKAFNKKPSWWRNEEFVNEVIEAVRNGESAKAYILRSYPQITNPGAVLKYLNKDHRQRYNEAQKWAENRFLLKLEWGRIREDAREESEETGEDVREIFKRWGVDCEFKDYRVGQKGDPRWREFVHERERQRINSEEANGNSLVNDM